MTVNPSSPKKIDSPREHKIVHEKKVPKWLLTIRDFFIAVGDAIVKIFDSLKGRAKKNPAADIKVVYNPLVTKKGKLQSLSNSLNEIESHLKKLYESLEEGLFAENAEALALQKERATLITKIEILKADMLNDKILELSRSPIFRKKVIQSLEKNDDFKSFFLFIVDTAKDHLNTTKNLSTEDILPIFESALMALNDTDKSLYIKYSSQIDAVSIEDISQKGNEAAYWYAMKTAKSKMDSIQLEKSL